LDPAFLKQSLVSRAFAAVIAGCLGVALLVSTARAATVTFTPAADTTLIQVSPNNNNGGQAWFDAGTTQNGTLNRGLFKFDLTSIPTNAVIRSASVVLIVVHQPRDGNADAPFGLYRMLRTWGEGTNVNLQNPGQGSPATAGEATWNYRFYSTNAWSSPGGVIGVDYSGVESSFQFVYGVGQSPYSFDTTPEMVGDVQTWVSNPESNCGWMLLCDDESTPFTARRFASREDPNNAPVLQLDYIVPVGIDHAQKAGTQFNVGFTAYPGQNYSVQYRDSLTTGTWQTLSNIPPPSVPTSVVVADPIVATHRFYRAITF
jgi:hypothetical protein